MSPVEQVEVTTVAAAWDWSLIGTAIDGADPAGPSLRHDGLYDDLRQARQFDDPSLPRGVWEVELKRADWPRVLSLAAAALEKRSKDLQLAAWMVEALVHLRGFQGLADGLRVINVLIELFWNDLHPKIDPDPEEGYDARLAPLAWLADKGGDMVRMVPISVVTPRTPRQFRLADWLTAQNIEHMASRSPAVLQRAAKDGTPSCAEIKLAILDLPPRLRDTLFQQIRAAVAEIGGLTQRVDTLCNGSAPSFGKLLEELHTVERLYLSLFPKLAESVMKPSGTREPRPAAEVAESGSPQARTAEQTADALAGILEATEASYGIKSREEAFVLLEAVAGYLMRTEPHSPVPYLVRRAVAWGDMSFAELLAQFISNPAELEHMYNFLGVGDAKE